MKKPFKFIINKANNNANWTSFMLKYKTNSETNTVK